ncbi:MAG TPA: diguanylate cyclase [Pseudoduganella sp.]|jgi:diguanylate cyclase (GGDEF)-like protein/PAS domain S-box-containing protein
MGNWLGRWRRMLARALAPDMVEAGELAAVREQLAQSERRFRAVTDNLPVIITQFDLDGRFTFINKYIGTVLQQRADTLLGTHLRDITGDALYDSVSKHIDKAFQGHKVEFDICYPVDGVDRHFTAVYSPELDDTGAVLSVLALWHDITERKQSELRLRTITDNVPAVICYLDPELKIEFANATFTKWLGKSASTVVGCRLPDLIAEFPDSPAAQGLMPFMVRALHGERVEFDFNTVIDGHERWLHYTVVPQPGPDGAVLGILALCADVSELKRVQRQLSEMARFDELTGLPNRYQFNEKMAEVVQRLGRAGQPMGLLFLDVDHFKQINDTHGHAAGDEVLREFARRLLASVRATDTVARLAGDEFVIVLEALSDRAAMQLVAEKILSAMQLPMVLSHGELRISSSIGGAFAEGGAVEPKLLLDCADLALYDAKRAGRATCRLRDYVAPAVVTP